MADQYSDSPPALLAVDSASPRISVAVGRGGVTLAEREAGSGRASPDLLRLIDEVLEEAGLRAAELGGAVAVRGPGSFTGLRVGLATLLGLHRSLDLPATAVPTFLPLAWQVRDSGGKLLAVVDALRGEWFSQAFRGGSPPEPLEEPTLRTPAALEAAGAEVVVGFGLGALADALGGTAELREARPLGPSLIEWSAAGTLDWDPRPLTEPLYLRPPAVTPRRP